MIPAFIKSKNALRLLAWGSAVWILWAAWQDAALAQGTVGTAEPVAQEESFFTDVLRSIFRFDTKGLMDVLSRPGYRWAAFAILNLIVFTETGLLIGFFLPGDSLLVITGLVCSNPRSEWDLSLLLISLCASAILGDTVGYWIGAKSGPKIFSREKSFFFAKDHLLKAQAFYEKHGGKTIILARFVPFLRTFAPVVAGVGRMEYSRFLAFNIVGGIGWVVSMMLTGRYLLPDLVNPALEWIFEREILVQDHIEKVVLIIVFLSITPMLYAWLKAKLASKAGATHKPVAHEALESPGVR